MRSLFIIIFICGFNIVAQAQRRQASNNRLGIALDATFFSLNTDDVAVDGKLGGALD